MLCSKLAMSNQESKRLKMAEGSGSGVQRESTSPKKICNLCSQKFVDITGTAAFVDKSLFIKAFLEADDIIVALAPRRFGKSTNMDMLKEFLSGHKDLFEKNKLKICEEESDFFDKNCEKNPVIHMDFKTVGGETKDEFQGSMKTVLQRAYDDHKYLVRSVGENWAWSDEKLKYMAFTIEKFMKYWKSPETLSRGEVIDGFKSLSQCLYVYHDKPVYVLIDEYDAPIMEAIMRTNSGDKLLDEIITLISKIMGSLLKGNEYVKRALINASVRIAEVLSSYANNIQYYEFLREPDFAPFFGFTAEEVEALFQREEFKAFRNDEVRVWYNGYQVMSSHDVIYSCYSILKYLAKSVKMGEPRFSSYWVEAGYVINMKSIFAKHGIRRHVEELVNGEDVEITMVQKMTKEHVQCLKSLVHDNVNVVPYGEASLFLQFLADQGYLNVVRPDEKSTRLTKSTVKVPNAEILKLLKEKCYDAELFQKKYNLSPKNICKYERAIQSVLDGRDKNAFSSLANAVSGLFLGATMPENEDEFHSILFAFAYNIKENYTRSELSVTRMKRLGRPPHLDILVVQGNVGMIIELKFENQSSLEAYEQIIKNKYDAAFDKLDVKDKILLGLHMNGKKEVSITHRVNESAIETTTSAE